jgi:hypothetical protein
MQTARTFHGHLHLTAGTTQGPEKEEKNLPVWLSLNEWLRLFDEDTSF